MKPLLRGHPDQRPPPLERPLDNVNLYINVLISTPDVRPPLLKGHYSDAGGVALQEVFHSILLNSMYQLKTCLKLFFILYISYICKNGFSLKMDNFEAC